MECSKLVVALCVCVQLVDDTTHMYHVPITLSLVPDIKAPWV